MVLTKGHRKMVIKRQVIYQINIQNTCPLMVERKKQEPNDSKTKNGDLRTQQ